MASRPNEHGQPIGLPVSGWTGAKPPVRETMEGVHCRLEPLDADRDAAPLFRAYAADPQGINWTYLPYGPFPTLDAYREWLREKQASSEECFFTIVDPRSQAPVGVAAYLRIAPTTGSIEIGHLSYAPALQRTIASTEAMFLMMRRVFDDWGYRRYEWKCDRLNAPSRAAAMRLGFRYEGLFRKLMVVKGRNRDTAWLSIVDDEWPAIRAAFEAWLDPGNFDAEGRQRRRLEGFMPVTAGQPIVVDVPGFD
ncbi:MAG: GNAT family N-acetyltransferase [Deltaproteobacteria bacterium]|nr:GNAT family N-acetyltransferase [Deltaproteobacteria bacterium]